MGCIAHGSWVGSPQGLCANAGWPLCNGDMTAEATEVAEAVEVTAGGVCELEIGGGLYFISCIDSLRTGEQYPAAAAEAAAAAAAECDELLTKFMATAAADSCS